MEGKSKMMKNKKGMGIGDLQTIGISFVVIAIVLGLGASVLTDIQTTQGSTTLSYNISGFGLTSLNTLGKWLPTIALVAVVAIIVGLVMVYLARQYGG
jgi:hypothetical protein